MQDKEVEQALSIEPAQMPAELREVQSYAAVFIKSGMFKDTTKLAQGIVKIMYGRELGIPELTAMRHISFVEGKPELDAALIASQIKKSNRYDYEVKNWSTMGCTVKITEIVNGKKIVQGEATFDNKDAAQAGLLTKTNWHKYPKSMYFARAISLAARTYCPDIFMGAVYATGEMSDSRPIIDGDTYQEPDAPAVENSQPVEAEIVSTPQQTEIISNAPTTDGVDTEQAARNVMDMMELTPPQKIEAYKAAYGRPAPPTSPDDWGALYGYLREVGMQQESEELSDD